MTVTIGTFNALVQAPPNRFVRDFGVMGKALGRFSRKTREETRDTKSAIARASLQARRDLNSLERHAKRTGRSVGGTFKNLRKTLKGGILPAAGIGGGLFALDRIIDSTDALAKNARAAGLTVERYQSLTFAAQKFGVSTDQMRLGLLAFNRRLGEARIGNAGFAKSFELLGVDINQTTEGALDQALASIAKHEQASDRAALASRVFGDDAGKKLALLLTEGTEGIDKQEKRARMLGLTSNAAAKNAELLADAQADLGKRLSSTINNAVLENATGLLAVAEAAIAAVGAVGQLISKLEQYGRRVGLLKAGSRIEEINQEIRDLNDPLFGPQGVDRQKRIAELKSERQRILNEREQNVLSGGGQGFGKLKPRANLPNLDNGPRIDITPKASPIVDVPKVEENLVKLNEATAAALAKNLGLWDENFKEKLRVTQIYSENILSHTTNMFGDLATGLGAFVGENSKALKVLFGISKAFAIADIIIKTRQAVQTALASYTVPFNLIAAAAAGARGLANLAVVKSQNFNRGGLVRGPGNSRSDSIPANLSRGEMVMNAAATRRHRGIFEAANQGADINGIGKPVDASDRASVMINVNPSPFFEVEVERVSGRVADASVNRKVDPLEHQMSKFARAQQATVRSLSRETRGLNR